MKIIRFLTIFLILIITIQLLYNEQSNLSQNLFDLYNNEQEALKVSESIDQNFAIITLTTANQISYPEIEILINDSYIADFSQGRVDIAVNEGDQITINTAQVEENVILIVEDISNQIKGIEAGDIIQGMNEKIELKTIEFEGKL